jgi:hypothetical protein
MKQNNILTIFQFCLVSTVMVISLCVFFVHNAFPANEKHSPGQIESTKINIQQEHNELVKGIKAELPSLIRKLKDGTPSEREKAANQLGFSEDAQSIAPLSNAVLHDSSPKVKLAAVNSLLYLAYRGGEISQFDILLDKQIFPCLKKALSDQNETVKQSAAIALYRLGEKTIAFPILESSAISGSAGVLNTFFYIPELSHDSLLVGMALPDKLSNPYNIEKAIDPDASTILLNIISATENAQVKIRAAEIIFHYSIEDDSYLIPYLKEIIFNSTHLDSRIKAISLLYEFGTPEAKIVIEEALGIDAMKSYAAHYLDYWNKKRN